MNKKDLKRMIDVAAEKYRSLGPYQRLVTAAGGAAIGSGLGSISLGEDSRGRKRGYLLGSEKDTSRVLGAALGAMAGLHVPELRDGVGRTSKPH